MEYRTIMIKNGEYLVPYNIYKCAICGEELEEAWPREEIDGDVYCGDCAFIEGLITDKEFKKKYLFYLQCDRVAVRDGEIHITLRKNEKFPWERTAKQDRHLEQYKEWRANVFERDGYKCAICGQVGGELNAHHIKSFARYKKQRFDIDNGITLCKKCHKNIHKEKNHEGIYPVESNDNRE